MDRKVELYMQSVIGTFTLGRANVEDAMRLMNTEMRAGPETQQVQLLALRRYLRLGGAKIVKQWAWTPAEAAKHTAETQDLMDEANEVVTAFQADNPGLKLVVSPIRDLQRQVHLWCSNATVMAAARKLIADTKAKLAKPAFLPSPTAAATEAFRAYLRESVVNPEPSSAVPGTSDHGQQHAVDFVVMQNGKPIADTKTATIVPNWQNTGFATKLKTATEKTPAALALGRPVLQGPLKTPYEPWHYALPKGSRKTR